MSAPILAPLRAAGDCGQPARHWLAPPRRDHGRDHRPAGCRGGSRRCARRGTRRPGRRPRRAACGTPSHRRRARGDRACAPRHGTPPRSASRPAARCCPSATRPTPCCGAPRRSGHAPPRRALRGPAARHPRASGRHARRWLRSAGRRRADRPRRRSTPPTRPRRPVGARPGRRCGTASGTRRTRCARRCGRCRCRPAARPSCTASPCRGQPEVVVRVTDREVGLEDRLGHAADPSRRKRRRMLAARNFSITVVAAPSRLAVNRPSGSRRPRCAGVAGERYRSGLESRTIAPTSSNGYGVNAACSLSCCEGGRVRPSGRARNGSRSRRSGRVAAASPAPTRRRAR